MKRDKDFIKVKKSSGVINRILGKKNIKMPALYYYKLGRFYIAEGKYEEAIAQFEKAIKLQPKEIEYYSILNNILFKLRNYTKALEYLDKIINLRPDLVTFQCKKGIAEASLGKDEKALKTFRKILDSSQKCAKTCFSLYYNMALSYYNIEKYWMAIKYFNKVLKSKPENNQLCGTMAWCVKGQSFGSLNKHKEALKCFNKALTIDPKHVPSLKNKALALNYLTKYKTALNIIDKVLFLNSKDQFALVCKSNLLDELGRHKEALRYINKAIKNNPKDDEALTSKGTILCGINRHGEEIKQYKRALKLNPKNYVAWINYGNELIRKGHFKEGIRYIDKALKINPQYESLLALKIKSIAFARLRKYKQAVHYLKKIIRIENKEGENYYNLACVYSLTNNINASFDMLRKALSLDKKYKMMARKDTDFRNIKNNKLFRKLIS